MEYSARERSINYDFMRVLMSLFVICIHTSLPAYINDNRLLSNFISVFLFQCNGIFFMISGKFNLCKKFECKKDYANYYANRFESILVPYGIVTCLLVLLEIIVSKQHCNLNGYIYQCIVAFFSTNASNHLWFICCLIGFLISTPFLAKMVTAMKDDELKVLFAIGICWNIIAIYLTADLGVSFNISGWFLWGWIFVYFLGYFCDRIINDNNVKIIYCLGITGFIISVLGKTYLDIFKYSTDLSVGFIFFTMSCYLFLQRHIVINNKRNVFIPIVTYMARYSFVAYMVHYFIIHNITNKFVVSNEGIMKYILFVLITFIISYIASILVSNIIIKPMQKLLRLFWKFILGQRQ